MPTLQQRLEFLMETGDVERNHTHPGLLQDRVARHSWGVAILAYMIGKARGVMSEHLLLAALTHDMGETASSDVCGATKGLLTNKTHAELCHIELTSRMLFDFDFVLHNVQEKKVLWLADKLEYMLRCIRERRMGNLGARRGFMEVYRLVAPFGEDGTAFEKELISTILALWKDAMVDIPTDFNIYHEVSAALKKDWSGPK